MTTEVWNETAPWTKKFRFTVKVNIYLQPCMYLKFENVNIENEGATDKNFLKFWNVAFQKGENRCRMNWPTDLLQHNITPFIGHPPSHLKYPKFQNSISTLTLAEVHTMSAFIKTLQIKLLLLSSYIKKKTFTLNNSKVVYFKKHFTYQV